MNIQEATIKHLRCDNAWLQYLKSHSEEDHDNFLRVCKTEWGNSN